MAIRIFFPYNFHMCKFFCSSVWHKKIYYIKNVDYTIYILNAFEIFHPDCNNEVQDFLDVLRTTV